LLLTWLPLLHLSQVLLDLDSAWIFAPISALILFPLLIELQPAFARLGRGRATAAIAAIAALFWLPPSFAPAYSEERKQRLSFEYAWDAAAGKAQLLAYHDRGPLPSPFKAAGNVRRDVEVPWSGYKRWAVDVKGPAIAPPEMERLGERSVGPNRLVTLRMRTRGADVVRLIGAEGVRFLAVRAGGSTRGYGEKGEAVLRCHGRSCNGMVFELLIAGKAPAEATVVGSRSGLPHEAAAVARSRAGNVQPQYVPDTSLAVDRIRL
jgi:hypothetical protein